MFASLARCTTFTSTSAFASASASASTATATATITLSRSAIRRLPLFFAYCPDRIPAPTSSPSLGASVVSPKPPISMSTPIPIPTSTLGPAPAGPSPKSHYEAGVADSSNERSSVDTHVDGNSEQIYLKRMQVRGEHLKRVLKEKEEGWHCECSIHAML